MKEKLMNKILSFFSKLMFGTTTLPTLPFGSPVVAHHQQQRVINVTLSQNADYLLEVMRTISGSRWGDEHGSVKLWWTPQNLQTISELQEFGIVSSEVENNLILVRLNYQHQVWN